MEDEKELKSEDTGEEILKEESIEEEVEITPKSKKPLIIILLLIILAAGAYFGYKKYFDKENNNPIDNNPLVYNTILDMYAKSAQLAIDNYMERNNGQIPKWEDIENDIVKLRYNVSCEHKINYNGELYLEKCQVEGIKYTSNYTYGKILEEPIKSDKELYIYKYEYPSGTTISIDNQQLKNIEYGKLIYTYYCDSDDCKGYNISQIAPIAIIYDNEKYFLYNYQNNTREEMPLGREKFNSITFLESDSKYYGLAILNDKEKVAFYNLNEKDYITNFDYNNASTYNVKELLENNYFAGIKEVGDKKYAINIINATTGAIVKSLDTASNSYATIQSVKAGNEVIYQLSLFPNSRIYKLYNSNFELLTGEDIEYNFAVNSDNTLTINSKEDKTHFSIYSNTGEKIKTSKEYQEIIKIVKDYIAILDEDDNLKLIDSKENEVADFLKITNDYHIHSMISGWHTENGKNGVYIVVENRKIPYGTEGSGLEYYYIPDTKESGVIKTIGVGGYAKPVLYLYPTKKIKVNITFDKPDLLTTTYPKYKNNWSITAYPNGDLYDKNNKYYYGLYWEEEGSNNIDFKTGFYVEKANALEFLEEKTNEIGLTRREANEFIMYWLPILEKNEKNLVYFELTDERDSYNKINISPKPDSLLRIAIHVKNVDRYTKIEEQKFKKFKRNGFVAVEWGGVVH